MTSTSKISESLHPDGSSRGRRQLMCLHDSSRHSRVIPLGTTVEMPLGTNIEMSSSYNTRRLVVFYIRQRMAQWTCDALKDEHGGLKSDSTALTRYYCCRCYSDWVNQPHVASWIENMKTWLKINIGADEVIVAPQHEELEEYPPLPPSPLLVICTYTGPGWCSQWCPAGMEWWRGWQHPVEPVPTSKYHQQTEACFSL